MTPKLQALHFLIVGGTGALLSFWAGWRARDAQHLPKGSYRPRDCDWQTRFNDENTNRPLGYQPRPSRPRDYDWRTRFNHENTNRPSGPPPLKLRRSEPPEQFIRMDEGPVQRGNGNGGPTTPKPLGYQPRPSRPGANPPPSEP
jgi:hypothetical protein